MSVSLLQPEYRVDELAGSNSQSDKGQTQSCACGNVIEPLFEARYHPDSYANRVGKDTHHAVDRL